MSNRAINAIGRRFLFLQGPHGPFFAGLAKQLTRAGATVGRVGFNSGDQKFWGRRENFSPYHGTRDRWKAWLEEHLRTTETTDIVCYGASRYFHKVALEVAREKGLCTHVFEEGYLRPYWVTYERGGTNAQSPLIGLSLDAMEEALDGRSGELRSPPDRWGETRQHVFWGAVYHAFLMLGRRNFPQYRPHRTPDPQGEFWFYINKLMSMPARRMARRLATQRIRLGHFPYHVVLLQLAHDANFRDNSNFTSQRQFLELVFQGFSDGAPQHHHLVLKAHPLEDGREPLQPLIIKLTQKYSLDGRIHFVSGGKLAQLLDHAESAVTVNSTSAEQALWRGLPLKAFGQAVYRRDAFTSNQPLAEFFSSPDQPDINAYSTYRQFLLETSQIRGGYYSSAGRRRLLRKLPDLMLSAQSPYEAVLSPSEARGQHLAVVN